MPLALPGDHSHAAWEAVGHTYQYEVAAARGDTETGPSSPVSITMPASEPTADPPSNITVTHAAGSTSITLSWSAPTDSPDDGTISDYQVFWEEANSGCTVQVPSEVLTGGLTSWAIAGLTAGHQYNFAVASVNAAGGGAWGGAPAAIAGDGAPAAPVISAASSNQLTGPRGPAPPATGSTRPIPSLRPTPYMDPPDLRDPARLEWHSRAGPVCGHSRQRDTRIAPVEPAASRCRRPGWPQPEWPGLD